MADRSQIEHRYSVLMPSVDSSEIDAEDFYRRGAFADTGRRMERYNTEALSLANGALAELERNDFSHLILASCIGFAAPGIDLQILQCLGLPSSVERTVVGFMGCSAAIPALRLARHIVRSDRQARVLVIAVELCSQHFQESSQLQQVLSFLLFGDGCAAVIVSGEPSGVEIIDLSSAILPDTSDYITWRAGASRFEMHLSGQVPSVIRNHLPGTLSAQYGSIEFAC